MSTTAFMPLRFLAQTHLFSVSLSITLPSTPSKPRTYTKGTRLRVDEIAGCHWSKCPGIHRKTERV